MKDRKKAVGLLWEKKFDDLEKMIPDAEKWIDFSQRVEKTMQTVLTDHKDCPIVVTHGQFIKTFLKQQHCWENIKSAWKGDERAPVKVVFKEGSWTTSLLVGL